jgi:LPXTG-site transpeptidase (sortase) family protein
MKRVGDVLIIISIAIFVVIYFPYWRPAKSTSIPDQIPKTGTYISIAAINAYAPVILDTDPWVESEYKVALQKGVAHAKGTSYPWNPGMSFLFAHSSLSPWEMTRDNTPFLSLPKVTTGEKIVITHDGQEFVFTVFDKKEVWPSQVSDVFERQDDVLILQTCTPLGTALKRLLVFAKKAV